MKRYYGFVTEMLEFGWKPEENQEKLRRPSFRALDILNINQSSYVYILFSVTCELCSLLVPKTVHSYSIFPYHFFNIFACLFPSPYRNVQDAIFIGSDSTLIWWKELMKWLKCATKLFLLFWKFRNVNFRSTLISPCLSVFPHVTTRKS